MLINNIWFFSYFIYWGVESDGSRCFSHCFHVRCAWKKPCFVFLSQAESDRKTSCNEMWWDLWSWSMSHESCICLLRGLSGAAPLVLLQFVCDAAPSNGWSELLPRMCCPHFKSALCPTLRMSVSNCIAVSPCNSNISLSIIVSGTVFL